jgi:hypothetical protein
VRIVLVLNEAFSEQQEVALHRPGSLTHNEHVVRLTLHDIGPDGPGGLDGPSDT